jgi:hypothetical protein
VLPPPPLPPPADVIVEKIEEPPCAEITGAGVPFAPPAPTVIGKVPIAAHKPAPASKGLSVYGSLEHLPSLNPPAPPPPPPSLEPPPPPATTKYEILFES